MRINGFSWRRLHLSIYVGDFIVMYTPRPFCVWIPHKVYIIIFQQTERETFPEDDQGSHKPTRGTKPEGALEDEAVLK